MEQENKKTNVKDNEFDKIESIANTNVNTNTNPITNTEVPQIKPQFDFYKDFEMRELLEKNSPESNSNLNNKEYEEKEIEMMLGSFPIINDNLRANILLSVEIYKKINNFEMTYVHEIVNEKTKKNL